MASSIPEQTNEEQISPPQPSTPLVIKRTGQFFNLMTIGTLVCTTVAAIYYADPGQYYFLIPAFLYALLYGGFTKFRIEGGKFKRSPLFWDKGRTRPDWERVFYIIAGFILIAWLSQESLIFIFAYFPLFGHTLGILGWRRGIFFYLLEVGTMLNQIGLINFDTLKRGLDFNTPFFSILISIIISLAFTIIVVALINSRLRSEELIHELTATKKHLETALFKEREIAVLRERNRLAREMHDVLGHALVLVAVKIEAAQRLQNSNIVEANQELDATKELVRQSMKELRASLAEMRNPALDITTLPLRKTLQEWANKMAQEGNFKLTCMIEPETELIPIALQDTLWLVGREALLNVLKHAQAKQVELRAFCKDQQLYLSVSDDGVGIPHLAEGEARLEIEGHYGLRGMRERLEIQDGHLVLKPNPQGKGTLLIASVPLPEKPLKPAQSLRKTLAQPGKWFAQKN